MSIAASVVVQPSRLLLAMVGLLCGAVLALGVMFACGGIADISPLMAAICALICMISAVLGFLSVLRRRQAWRLDISGVGQIRLSSLGPGQISLANSAQNTASPDGILVTLLADSTIWPGFLMLRLKSADGRLYQLPILTDCLPPESFRAVAVACRWIAGHDSSD